MTNMCSVICLEKIRTYSVTLTLDLLEKAYCEFMKARSFQVI